MTKTKFLQTERRMFYTSPSSSGSNPSPETLATVLLHDLLFSRGIQLPREHRVRKAIEKHATRSVGFQLYRGRRAKLINLVLIISLKAEKEREKVRLGVSSDAALKAGGNNGTKTKATEDAETVGSGTIRWMRVNELKWDLESAISWMEEQGWQRAESVDQVASSVR
jgi:putative methyltransferase